MSSSSSAALAAKRCRSGADKIDGAEFSGEIVGHSDNDRALAVGRYRNERNHSRSHRFLSLVGQALQVFGIDAFDDPAHELHATHIDGLASLTLRCRHPWRAAVLHPPVPARAVCVPRADSQFAAPCPPDWLSTSPPHRSAASPAERDTFSPLLPPELPGAVRPRPKRFPRRS